MYSDPSLPPSRALLLLEWRALWELGGFYAAYPLLRLAPRGDRHPVLVIPGLGASDTSTRPLRRFLRDQGWTPYGWKQGPNHGPKPGVQARLHQRVAALAEQHGSSVSVVGWSLGGVYAREIAHELRHCVRQVVTLGSPFAGPPRASNAWRLYESLSGRRVDDWPHRDRMRRPPPVPSTAIYTRTDGIVAWQGCLEEDGPASENIEIEASHCGLGHHPAALYAIADRLAQPQGNWRRFDRSGWRSIVYRDPRRDPAGAAASASRSAPLTA